MSSKVFIAAGIVSVIAVSSISSAAFAWHPEGNIVKKVQNVTANSAVSDANTSSTAVSAKPGDILKYTIEVRNDAKPASKQWNDMDKTVMRDTLPAGVELVSSPSTRQITENLGLIVPGKKVVKEYTVKVTAKTNGSIINTACFTGDTVVNDNPQKGCDKAIVTVTVPPVVTPEDVPVAPVVPETPEAPAVETPVEEAPVVVETPLELPKTGPVSTSIVAVLTLGLLTYVVSLVARTKRSNI